MLGPSEFADIPQAPADDEEVAGAAAQLAELTTTEKEGGIDNKPTEGGIDNKPTEAAAVDEGGAQKTGGEPEGALVTPTKLFVGGLQPPTTNESLVEYFRAFGPVVEVVMKPSRPAQGRPGGGYGFLVMRNAADAEAIMAQEHKIDGRTIPAPTLARAVEQGDSAGSGDAGAARGRRAKGGARGDAAAAPPNSAPGGGGMPPGGTAGLKLFVGGLSHDTTDGGFTAFFEQFGRVVDSIIMYDHMTNRSRGFGFVTFAEPGAVQAALSSNFHQLNGRAIEVKLAVPREEMAPRPGPQGRGRRGGSQQSSGWQQMQPALEAPFEAAEAFPSGEAHHAYYAAPAEFGQPALGYAPQRVYSAVPYVVAPMGAAGVRVGVPQGPMFVQPPPMAPPPAHLKPAAAVFSPMMMAAPPFVYSPPGGFHPMQPYPPGAGPHFAPPPPPPGVPAATSAGAPPPGPRAPEAAPSSSWAP